MSATQIRGNTQIQGLTIMDGEVATNAAIQTSKLADGPKFIKSDGTVPMLAPLQLGTGTAAAPAGTQQINQVANPTNPQDVATKNYVDTAVSGIASAGASTLVTTVGANITLSGTQTIDGIALAVGNKVLVKDQTTQANNGIYQVQTGAWTRDPSMNSWAQVPGMIISVEEGTTMHDTVWLSTADPGGTLGTTPITFVQIPGPSDIIAGAGLQRAGQTLNIVAADNSIALTTGPGTIAVKDDPARAITTTAAGIGVNIDATTLAITSNVLGVKSGVYQPAGAYLGYANFVIRETPTGTINGSNTTFTLANSPQANTEQIFLNGMLLEPGVGNDYTISGATITMLVVPQTGDRLKASYLK